MSRVRSAAPTTNETFGREVWQQDFLKLKLPDNYFDGVFANAALFHVPSQELPRVLLELHASLKPGGVLFSSNPHGHNEEGWNGGRYSVYHDVDTWRGYVSAAGFAEINHYYRPRRTTARKTALAGKRLASLSMRALCRMAGVLPLVHPAQAPLD